MCNDLTVKKIVEIVNGELFCGSEDVLCTTFTKDTRTIQSGDTYIGIKGEKFDGNLFYKEAFSSGAICVILEKGSFIEDKEYNYDQPIVLVENSILALKKLGEYKRNTSTAHFVGVTGSVGKTSTRDMIYSVLKREYKTLKTEGNYNNNIGLPLTLLRLSDENAAVIEMGMNALGEIDYLSRIARPHISVITNVGTAHIGELGSRENILKAKLEICNGMDEKGILVINNDNDMLHDYYLKKQKNIVTVGIDNASDFMATEIESFADSSKFIVTFDGKKYEVLCPVPGEAFIYNSLVSFAVGVALNIAPEKIIKGIKDFTMTKNRLEMFTIQENILVINDVYNASVDSMKSSLEILKNKPAKRHIAILGSMLELGDFSKSLHEQVGEIVVDQNIDILITVGEDAKYIASRAVECGMAKENVYSFVTNEDGISFIKDFLQKEDAVLLKASNGMHFIEIVNTLKKLA